MDIDKDTIRPPPPARRKRPSVVKCIIVLCALIGALIFGLIVYFMGKGFYHLVDTARNPHQSLYLNATSNETAILPFIGKDETFDVYLTIWARLSDEEAGIPSDEDVESAKERFGGGWDTIKTMVRNPEMEILFDAKEKVVFAEKIFESVRRKDRNLHKDISFELPLERFRDQLIYPGDVRAAAVLIPSSQSLKIVKEWTGWKPEGALSFPRLDDETAAQLGLKGIQRDALDAVSVSFGLLELHDKNYMNRTEEEGEHEYFPDLDADLDTNRKELMKGWSTYQPHFITKSHVVLVDESRPLNRTAWEKKHKALAESSCGQNIGLKPTRFLCHRGDYNNHGDWEHRLVLNTDQGDDVRYGPYVGIMNNMAGPRHLLPLPVKRGVPFNKSTDKSSVKVHHQFTFSSFTPGRKHLIDNFVGPSVSGTTAKNATEAQLIHAHNDWEQWMGVLGNRGKDTHPRTRLIVTLFSEVFLSLPIMFLGLLYWYTRTTSAGIDSIATLIGGGAIVFAMVAEVYMGSRAKSVGWELFVFIIFLSVFDLSQGYLMIRLVLPFEVVWRGWTPSGLVRSRWTKRERATRRLEGKTSWVQRGLLGTGLFALVYAIHHYDIDIISPLVQVENQFTDTQLPNYVRSLIDSAKFLAIILQIITNHYTRSFAGLYALEAYLIGIRRVVRLLEFWPWFIGRYEVRGGIGAIDAFGIMIDMVIIWQAWTLPRVEQVVPDDDE